jgi:hypothetical protein
MQQQQSTFAKLLLYNWLIRVIRKVTLYSPCLWASFHLLSPHFQWYPQSHEILLNVSMKCWISAFNAQRLIIIGALKIYVEPVEALRQKERQDETQFTTKFDSFFFSFTLSESYCIFFRFWKISPHVWPNWGLWWCFAYFTDNSINHHKNKYIYFSSFFYVKSSFPSGKSLPQSEMAPFM